jgi:hypothetical protein
MIGRNFIPLAISSNTQSLAIPKGIHKIKQTEINKTPAYLAGFVIHLLGSLWLVASLTIFETQAEASTLQFYVATTGSDTSPGTIEQPFASLEAARNAIRMAKTAGYVESGATVWIRGGIYERSKTFQLTSQDSGTPNSPIVYSGYPGEVARFIGGKILTDFHSVTNPDILARLHVTARTNVLVADLRANGITNFGKLSVRGMGLRCPTVPAHLELFFNEKPMILSRWPNEGQWDHIAGFPAVGAQSSTIGNLTNGFFYSGDRPGLWKDPTNIWVHGYWEYDWADSYERIDSLDLKRHLIVTAAPYGQYGFKTGQRFYYLNILEELDQPGEYYTDTGNGLLYFWPPNPATSGEVLASVLEAPFVNLSSTTNISFSSLTFEATRGSAFRLNGAVSNMLSGLTIKEIGNNAVEVAGGKGDTVLDCKILDIGDSGVILNGGDRSTLAPSGHLVQNCYFDNVGRWSRTFVPAIKLSGVGQRAANNLIENHPFNAIWFDGNEHMIECNEIRHVACDGGDVGAIYGGRDYTYRGNVIRYNYLHDINGPGLWGSRGVYMDDCISGTQIYGNIFVNVPKAVFIGGGRDHNVENNIFINCNPAIDMDGRGLSKDHAWAKLLPTLKQRLDAVPAGLYRSRYPAIRDIDKYYASESGVPPENDLVHLNICVGTNFTSISKEALPFIRIASNYVGPDPGFVNTTNPAASLFQFEPDAALLALGFRQIPFANIGIH